MRTLPGRAQPAARRNVQGVGERRRRSSARLRTPERPRCDSGSRAGDRRAKLLQGDRTASEERRIERVGSPAKRARSRSSRGGRGWLYVAEPGRPPSSRRGGAGPAMAGRVRAGRVRTGRVRAGCVRETRTAICPSRFAPPSQRRLRSSAVAGLRGPGCASRVIARGRFALPPSSAGKARRARLRGQVRERGTDPDRRRGRTGIRSRCPALRPTAAGLRRVSLPRSVPAGASAGCTPPR